MGDVPVRDRCHLDAVLRLFTTALVALALVLPAAAAAGLTRSEQALLRRVNDVRAHYGLRTLRPDVHLERAARAHSAEMLTSGVFTHGDFGGRMRQFDVVASLAGENIAWGTGSQGSAAGVISMWLASPGHRANLLNPSYRRIGVASLLGSFQGYRGAHVVTADFAG